LRAPPFSRARFLLPARSVLQQRLGINRLARDPQLDRYCRRIRLRPAVAVFWYRRLPAARIRFWDGDPLVSFPQGGFAGCEALGGTLATDVLSCPAGALAGTYALVGRTSRRPSGNCFRGFSNPLL